MNDTSGAPPSAANGVNIDSPWLNATRTQGNPPAGKLPRSHSCATHRQAAHSGQPRSRITAAAPAAIAAKNTLSSATRPSQASYPTGRTQASAGSRNASADSRPSQAARRGRVPYTDRVISARPRGARYHRPSGGKAR